MDSLPLPPALQEQSLPFLPTGLSPTSATILLFSFLSLLSSLFLLHSRAGPTAMES